MENTNSIVGKIGRGLAIASLLISPIYSTGCATTRNLPQGAKLVEMIQLNPIEGQSGEKTLRVYQAGDNYYTIDSKGNLYNSTRKTNN